MNIPAFYCALCWQQFDHPNEHDAGSFVDVPIRTMKIEIAGAPVHKSAGVRVNRHCSGDIRPSNPTIRKRIRRMKQKEVLSFPEDVIKL